MIAYVNSAGATFIGTYAGTPMNDEHTSWRCSMRLVPGALAKDVASVRPAFSRLVKAHARANGWRVTKVEHACDFVALYITRRA